MKITMEINKSNMDEVFRDLLDRNVTLETFIDAADECYALRKFAAAALVQAQDPANEIDNVAQENLKILDQVLKLAQDLFIDCDEYYRR